ncbi:formate-dependent phosphoribosylglycinamide formyltransferase [Sulfurimonas paralvinellae]|uniref:Formate-dependent phosphoribosylglycinamide formyltransferase n=1 Tax=Sulfurimonas paralvinellae TaxID=317658 RepID=A0A7M1B568_9BACT|nr:formate-dependent phosphoribosylglycinamide formyltransferase [Sulfurimonas paralvinellae]QOP44810.1 formate-dependent phosphoribosylglycinamide formyltransferase [Sulfurimonas paralvinellae]
MRFSAPLKSNSKKIMLLGSGELGKEVIIEAQRLGLETIAVDRYADAPAHQVAHRSHVVNMQDKDALLEIIYREKPDYILPEIEALSIDALFEAEDKGYNVIPNANAVSKTMNRKNIRTFAAETLGLKTGPYEFVTTEEGLRETSKRMGYPCVIKPVMSSSGHGQSICRSEDEVAHSWEIAKEARGDASELIVEAFVDFDYEITMLTARNGKETVFCEPIGHEQRDGDYVFSWQPMQMSEAAKKNAQDIAKAITDGLGGQGIFGVELFVKGDEVYFSEVSPRPHDTGMVTLITQSQSEFALHLRAVLGLPLGFTFYGDGASAAFKSEVHNYAPVVDVDDSLFSENSFVRVFGKPEAHKGRRLAVALVFDKVEAALEKARELITKVKDA